MRKIIVGNWKMHGSKAMARELIEAVKAGPATAEIVLCPPAVLLDYVGGLLAGSAIALGGQDCHAWAQGAFTGDTSAGMLKEMGCSYVIVGHSERRQWHGETNAHVRAKAARAMAGGLTPIICIGETAHEREVGQANDVIARQLAESLPERDEAGNFLLAYEPVWAIGSGSTPTNDDIARMHAHIGSIVADSRVLYGGSVNGENAGAIMRIEGVAGVLVGGASLKANEFCKIAAG